MKTEKNHRWRWYNTITGRSWGSLHTTRFAAMRDYVRTFFPRQLRAELDIPQGTSIMHAAIPKDVVRRYWERAYRKGRVRIVKVTETITAGWE